MDISFQQELDQLGAVYYLNGEQRDVFELLKECGTDMIRLRIWVDPYDDKGQAYGGGTNDLATTMNLAKRVKDAGMKILLDFHYSDFWADPGKQIKPKAWKKLGQRDLELAVHYYTRMVLERMTEEKLAPDMIQIGNEITNGLLWPEGHVSHPKAMIRILQAGTKAARDVLPDAKLVIHLDSGSDSEMYRNWFEIAEKYGLDFDIIGMSYYPHFNGSLEELLTNMNLVSKRFDKDVMICETSIGYTLDNLKIEGMLFGEDEERLTGFPASPEGQEEFLHTLFDTVRAVKGNRGIGVFYWEPSWLPIPEATWGHQNGCKYMMDSVTACNSNGNQALFDAFGNANPALIHLKNL